MTEVYYTYSDGKGNRLEFIRSICMSQLDGNEYFNLTIDI